MNDQPLRHVDGLRRVAPAVAALPEKNRPRPRLHYFVIPFLFLVTVLITQSPKVFALVGGKSEGAASSHAGHTIRQPAALTNGLIAWYPLDGNANDYSGHNANGTLNNFTLNNTTNGWVAGKFGTALMFDGTSDSMSTSGVGSSSANVSVSAWVNPSASQVGTIVFANGSYYLGLGYAIGNSNSGKACAAVIVSGWQYVCSTNPVPLNAWSHLAMTYDGTTLFVYLNGVQVASSTAASGSLLGGPSPSIGNFSTFNYFHGSLDDVRIYNRAISASEVAQLYAGSTPTNCDQTCVGWWKLDEASGTTAKDGSGNGNDGTLTNFTFDGTTNGWVSGVFGNGLLFGGSGSSENVSLPSSPAYGFGAGPFTVSVWFNPSTTGNTPIISLGGSNTNYGEIASNFNASSLSYYAYGQRIHDSVPVTSGSWMFATLVGNGGANGSRNIKLYRNGVQVGSTYTFDYNFPQQAFTIGVNQSSGAEIFKGTIDDVRIYNRALTDYEIYDQYMAGK